MKSKISIEKWGSFNKHRRVYFVCFPINEVPNLRKLGTPDRMMDESHKELVVYKTTGLTILFFPINTFLFKAPWLLCSCNGPKGIKGWSFIQQRIYFHFI